MNGYGLYKLGTDVAGFALYHPARLAQRVKDPPGWWMDDAQKEFREGRLVAFCTGSDGTFTMKFTQRPLSTAEQQAEVVRESFRFHLRDGRLFWDNTDCLPSDEQFSEAEEDPNGWLELPNGRYRITVHALDWFTVAKEAREAEPDISHYLVRVEPVSSFRGVPAPVTAPWLQASKAWHAQRLAQRSAESAPESGE